MNTKFHDQVVAARSYLTCRYPFYAYLLFKADIVPDYSIPTACVNKHGRISINPDFFDAIPEPIMRCFVLAHEILHPAFGIFWRSKGHNPSLSNRAHDYVINWILFKDRQEKKKDGGVLGNWVLPGALLDKRFAGMPYEEVYYLLKSELPIKNIPKHGEVRVNNPEKLPASEYGDPIDGIVDVSTIGGLGGDVDGAADEEGDEGKSAIDWNRIVARAAAAARMAGKMPAHLERLVGDLLEPVISWQDQLRLAVSDALSKTRLDWSNPHRRSEAYGYYAPREEHLGFDVSICVDTSGSIAPEELKRAVSEIDAIVKETSGEGRYIVGDAVVHKDVLLTNFHPDMLKGGGGTSFVPHFEHLAEHPTKLCVFFTDTFGEFPKYEPAFPVIWAVYKPAMSRASVPFGEIIEVAV